jgi:glycosyltransferase involved in cell wall biosynthesis
MCGEDIYCREILSGIKVEYITNKRLSPILQEILSPLFIKIHNDYDVHLEYGSLISGYYVAKKLRQKNVPTIMDIADDNIDMIRNSPQIPKNLRKIGASLGIYISKKNINIAKYITITATTLKDTYDIPDNKIVLIPNGVDTDIFKILSSSKEKFGLKDSFIVGYVGVLREWVDLRPVFLAIRNLAKRIDLKMVIVGKEGMFEENKKLAKECGIETNVIFYGNISYNMVPEYIAMMDICVIPFKNNSVTKNALPLKLFEYMACGKPVISTRLPNVKKAVGNGVLYADNRQEFENAIIELYTNTSMTKNLSSAGIKIAKEYSWDSFLRTLDKVLLKVKG